jgi:hypothetical protein
MTDEFEHIHPCLHGVAGLPPEPTRGQQHRFTLDQPAIKPGGAGRRHLTIEVNTVAPTSI